MFMGLVWRMFAWFQMLVHKTYLEMLMYIVFGPCVTVVAEW